MFPGKHRPLALDSPAITAESTVAPQYAMAGNEPCDRTRADRLPNGAAGGRLADSARRAGNITIELRGCPQTVSPHDKRRPSRPLNFLSVRFLSHAWRVLLEDEPIFDRLRTRKDFQALLADCQSIEARERELFLRMRAEGRIPDRSSKIQAQARRGTSIPSDAVSTRD